MPTSQPSVAPVVARMSGGEAQSRVPLVAMMAIFFGFARRSASLIANSSSTLVVTMASTRSRMSASMSVMARSVLSTMCWPPFPWPASGRRDCGGGLHERGHPIVRRHARRLRPDSFVIPRNSLQECILRSSATHQHLRQLFRHFGRPGREVAAERDIVQDVVPDHGDAPDHPAGRLGGTLRYTHAFLDP